MQSPAGSTPAFYFINPAGVVFAEGANVDVPGSLHITTADSLNFKDGSAYHADSGKVSSFSTTAPESFGFLGNNPARVQIIDGATILTPDAMVEVVAGDVELDNGGVIWNFTGDVKVTAVGSQSVNVAVADSGIDENINASGRVSVTNGSYIASTSFAGDANTSSGDVAVQAGNIVLDRGTAGFTGITSDVYAEQGSAGKVSLRVADTLQVLNGARVQAGASDNAQAGALDIRAKNIQLDGNRSQLSAITNPDSTGTAGNLSIIADESIRLTNGAYISGHSEGTGNAGEINIKTTELYVEHGGTGFTGINTDAYSSQANAGRLALNVGNTLTLLNGARVQSRTDGQGNAGIVNIKANAIVMDGNASQLSVYANAGSSGDAGSLSVVAGEKISLTNGAYITAHSEGSGNAGTVDIHALDIYLEHGQAGFTGITSDVYGAQGHAGSLSLNVDNSLRVFTGAKIQAKNSGVGDAGTVNINAGSIVLDGPGSQVGSFMEAGSTGNAGSISITARDAINITNGAYLVGKSNGQGHGGQLTVEADNLTFDGGEAGFAGIEMNGNTETASAGNINLKIVDQVRILNGAFIGATTSGEGDGGTINISANKILIDDGGISSNSYLEESKGKGGFININTTGSFDFINDSFIDVSSRLDAAGAINIKAGEMLMDGDSIIRAVNSSGQPGGLVDVEVDGLLNLKGGSSFFVNSPSDDRPAYIWIKAKDLWIDGDQTEIRALASVNASVPMKVDIDLEGLLSITNGAQIAASALAFGQGGTVEIDAKEVVIDGKNDEGETGILTEAWATFGVFKDKNDSGNIVLNVTDKVSILNGGIITSKTESEIGDGGDIIINAKKMLVDGQNSERFTGIDAGTDPNPVYGPPESGNSGNIFLNVSESLKVINGANIQSNTKSTGSAGNIVVLVGELLSVQGENSSIQSETSYSGNAGNLTVVVDNTLHVSDGGKISTSTRQLGKAGSIDVNAGNIFVDGEFSRISADAIGYVADNPLAQAFYDAFNPVSGQTGYVSVVADNNIKLSDGGRISILNSAKAVDLSVIYPTTLTVTAPNIDLENASITAASYRDVNASDIIINFTNRLYLDPSSITTSAVDGDGGSITINGGGLVFLDNSQISTSVSGQTGSGGDITINTDGLVLNTGFIQANTAAANAFGGDININADTLMASGYQLSLGGDTQYQFIPYIYGYNVIQAAAPDGISGDIQLASPVIDISDTLTILATAVFDAGGLGRSPCQTTGGNGFTVGGRGTVPASMQQPISLSSLEKMNIQGDIYRRHLPLFANHMKGTCNAL